MTTTTAVPMTTTTTSPPTTMRASSSNEFARKEPPSPVVSCRTTLAHSDPTKSQIRMLLHCCRKNQWSVILHHLQDHPHWALQSISMDNSVKTTILHQALSSRGSNVQTRVAVAEHILALTPQCAAIPNGNGSLPLHVIAQRNIHLPSIHRQDLMHRLLQAHPAALVTPGGVGGRTPLHIAFTDYLSPALTQLMIDRGPAACSMLDRQGWLPAHMAAHRHVSPPKLAMLLRVYPAALTQPTPQGDTLLSLAKAAATATHPNRRLIAFLEDCENATTGTNFHLLLQDKEHNNNSRQRQRCHHHHTVAHRSSNGVRRARKPVTKVRKSIKSPRRVHTTTRAASKSKSEAELLLEFSHQLMQESSAARNEVHMVQV